MKPKKRITGTILFLTGFVCWGGLVLLGAVRFEVAILISIFAFSMAAGYRMFVGAKTKGVP